MKVLITDYTFPDISVEQEIIAATKAEVVGAQAKTQEALIPLVSDADVVITQFAPVNTEVIQAMSKARVIIRYGIGVDNVQLETARQKNIPVCNVPDYCIDEVADHTLAFILSSTRQVVPNSNHVQSGKWGLATGLDQMRTLRDLTVGIVGFGRIGREVAVRLAPFKCRRLVFDPMVQPEKVRLLGCEPVSLPELLEQSNVVTLHCPSTPETRRMINSESISRMTRGAILVNLARGDLVDTPALIEGLKSGQISNAALDVFDKEPLPADSPLRSMPNVTVASHIASASVKAVRQLRETVAKIAVMAIRGEKLPNIVNGVGR